MFRTSQHIHTRKDHGSSDPSSKHCKRTHIENIAQSEALKRTSSHAASQAGSLRAFESGNFLELIKTSILFRHTSRSNFDIDRICDWTSLLVKNDNRFNTSIRLLTMIRFFPTSTPHPYLPSAKFPTSPPQLEFTPVEVHHLADCTAKEDGWMIDEDSRPSHKTYYLYGVPMDLIRCLDEREKDVSPAETLADIKRK